MLDNKPIEVSTALNLAFKFYDEENMKHAMRVALHVAENALIPREYLFECISLALMHDLLEDTEFVSNDLPENFTKALNLLTKPKYMPYNEYCKKIHDATNTNWGMCAYWVKLADMSDHLSQTDTLTDRLKQKYLSGLRYLL